MKKLTLTKAARAELFNETAARRAVTSVIVEKDYWVCVALGGLFSETQPVDLLFKGGTSLSKGYGLVERFSEDVDLAFDRAGLGFTGARDPEAAGLSNTRRKALIEALTDSATTYIQGDFLEETRRRLAAVLPAEDWSLTVDQSDAQTLLFAYPVSLESDLYASADYIRPVVRLEFGARSDPDPTSMRTVTAFVTEEFGDKSDLEPIDVPMLTAERTFWEKATLLHAEAHRETPRADAAAMSRHLYDLAKLAESEFGERAIDDDALFDRVVAHKSLYFASANARYDLCVRGTLRLLPVETAALKRLERDYSSMEVMFLGDRPRFKALIETLNALEARLNRR